MAFGVGSSTLLPFSGVTVHLAHEGNLGKHTKLVSLVGKSART
jgi:hypothetical protein